MFAQKQQWWDVMCNVGTGEVVLSDAVSVPTGVVAPGLLLVPAMPSGGSSVTAGGGPGSTAPVHSGPPTSAASAASSAAKVQSEVLSAGGTIMDLGPSMFSPVAWRPAETAYFEKVGHGARRGCMATMWSTICVMLLVYVCVYVCASVVR